jgi:acyl-CoA thioesterase I
MSRRSLDSGSYHNDVMKALWPLLAIVLTACSVEEQPRSVEIAAPAPRHNSDAAKAVANRPKIVVLGDSLTAGYGLAIEQSYPSLLQQRLDAAGLRYEVVNAGVSGDTSAGGVSRVDWALQSGGVSVLVVALGGNDGLRGIPVAELRRNLSAIVERGKQKGARVLLAGMEAPPNMGPAYTTAFRQVYRDVARQHDVPLIPFLLDRVAVDRALNIRDGIHPNAEGARIVEDTVWRGLEPLLDDSDR